MANQSFIIDFDSTFIKVETLDVLAEVCLADDPLFQQKLDEIKEITSICMSGGMSFRASLTQRLAILNAHKSHLPLLIEKLKKQISTSFDANADFFQQHKDHIYIISSGFKACIVPVVAPFGISEQHVFANEFVFDDNGYIVGFNTANPLSNDNGKVAILQQLKPDGDLYMIGDGYNDYEVKKAGLVNKFYAFTENIERKKVTQLADHITPTLDEILYLHQMNTKISYPKNRINVLLLENIHPNAFHFLKEEGYNVELVKDALDEDELAEKIKDVSILGVRSKTLVTKKVLANAKRLIAIGAYCIGTNQLDLEECQRRGVVVFNAPFSNTRSVVELVIAKIIMLMRNISDVNAKMHKGIWHKSATNSSEIRGKKLGIIGYGNIGAQLSVLAEALGMDVYYYDVVEKLPLGNVTKCQSLQELLEKADVVTLHVDGRAENHHLIGDKEFSLMKNGVVFLNLSRGPVVDIEALKANIESGKIKGAGIDVFPYEPKTNDEPFTSPLIGVRNTILTPHIGGSTEEAQINIADFVPNRIIHYVNTGSTTNSVNFPNLQLPTLENAHRLIHIHHNKSGILAKINQVLAKHNTNIVGQYLKTNEFIGYVITDIDKAYNKEVVNALKLIDGTIKFRVLY